ncbi:glycosyl-phosphatidylinositol-anchored molecule-like protein [Equus przewalskii]|uniref:Glycosyl-phosphatidylinositol-anchored molecule-like protein n=1 Tax=Equus przewalskii TaxID=9798 RepID=A0ABM4QCY0_EQUPR
MMLAYALLLAVVLPVVDMNATGSGWTYSLRCHDCWAINTFVCANVRTCPYHVRRCLTVSIRLNLRELLIYKNCTYNCTFIYTPQMPPEAPRRFKTNSFYYVQCCNHNTCNHAGPTNVERDIVPPEPIEEVLEGTVRLGESTFFLSFASILISNSLT